LGVAVQNSPLIGEKDITSRREKKKITKNVSVG